MTLPKAQPEVTPPPAAPDPAPIPSDWYDRSYYEHLNRGAGGEHEVFQRALSLAEPLAEGARSLDVGCGRGELVAALARRRGTVVGIDYSAAALQMARERLSDDLPPDDLGRMELRPMDAKRLEFSDGSFDRVFMLDVVEHLHPWELEACAREVARILAPGGRVIVHTCPNRRLFAPVRAVARVARISIGSDRYHVNEQHDTSLRRVFGMLDTTTLTLRDPEFWTNAVGPDRPALRRLGSAIDGALNLGPVARAVDREPLVRALGTNVWMVGRKRNAPGC